MPRAKKPKPGANCSSSCLTKDHATFGECVRGKRLNVGYCGQGGGDATAQKKWDAELQAYRDARRQGIQPDGTTMPKIRKALEESDKHGAAYGRDFNVAAPMEVA
jgi:hypothetical protein